jgi:hypothetical protein
MDLLFLLPLVFGLVGVYSALCMSHKPSMVMAILLWPSAFVLFLFCALLIIPTIFMADICHQSNLDLVITSNLGSATLPTNTLNGFLSFVGKNLTGPDPKVSSLYSYWMRCIPPEPEVFLALGTVDPNSPALQQFNLGSYSSQINNTVTSQGLAMAPTLTNAFSTLSGASTYLASQTKTFHDLMECKKTSPLWSLTRDEGLCTRAAGSFALSVIALGLFGICIWPGLCLGVRGFKRFDVRNSEEPPALSADDQKSKDKKELYAQNGPRVLGMEDDSEVRMKGLPTMHHKQAFMAQQMALQQQMMTQQRRQQPQQMMNQPQQQMMMQSQQQQQMMMRQQLASTQQFTPVVHDIDVTAVSFPPPKAKATMSSHFGLHGGAQEVEMSPMVQKPAKFKVTLQ